MGFLGIYPVSMSSSIDDQWNRSSSRPFTAAFTIDCDENYARANLGTTFQINQPHPTDTGQVVSGIEVSCADDMASPSTFVDPTPVTGPSNPDNGEACYWWSVTITYGPWDPLTHTATGDPADQPIDYSFDWQVFEQPADFAYNPSSGALEPVINSAGDPFDPPVTREQLKGVMRVAWNAHTFSPYAFFSLGNLINSDTWNGFPPFTVKFSPPKMPQRLWSQFLGANYFRLEAEFGFNPNNAGWNAYPIDRGFRCLNGSGQPTKIFDVNGMPVSQPALLNGSGGVLPPSGTGFYQFNWQIYTSTAFASAFPTLSDLF